MVEIEFQAIERNGLNCGEMFTVQQNFKKQCLGSTFR